ncbi:MAG: type II toxin-antitoxin system PemK/MazF family toxin [Egibacteraceae bacterium]
MICRGQLWWADLGEPRGSAPAFRRHVLIVQADSYDPSRLRTVVVATVTTDPRLAAMRATCCCRRRGPACRRTRSSTSPSSPR